MKRILYITCVVLLGLTGCSDYLDIVPKGKVIPKETQDYRLLLNQIDFKGGSNGFVDSYNTDVFLADDIKVTPFSESQTRAEHINALKFEEHIYEDGVKDGDWENLYNNIYVANLVITQVMSSSNGTEAEKRELLAEASAHRAFAYLTLVNLYSKHYNAASASTDLGVPLRVNIDFEESLKRASVQDVYDLIIEDLNLAAEVESLPTSPELDINYRPTKASVYALLSRTYLYMNQIDEALKYADLSIGTYNTLMNYNSFGPGFIPFILAYPVGLQNPEITQLKEVRGGIAVVYQSDAVLNLMDQANDLRFKTSFLTDMVFGQNFGFFCTDFFNRLPYVGPSTVKTYLNRAECYARKGDVSKALADLNHIRSFRFVTGSAYQLSASTPEEALTLVKEERRRELAFKGVRLFDIKRYNLIDNANISVTHTVGGVDYTAEAGSPKLILPIARIYIDLNPEIEQNPR